MKLERSDRFLKDEKGSVAVIEASVIYPLVILSIAAMIYIGMYIFEASYLNDRARSAAVTAAKTVSFTGYEALGDIYVKTGLNPEDEKPDRTHVDKAYSKSSPYRYLRKGQVSERFTESISEYAAGGLFSVTDISFSVDVERRLFDREVNVTLEKSVRLPGVLKTLGIAGNRTIKVTASAVTSDPAEFIRNTDLTLRAAEFAGKKTGAAEKFSEIRKKISRTVEKLKAGVS